MKHPVSNAAKRLLIRENERCIGYGCAGWLDSIYDSCYPYKRNIDNAQKWEAVLSAIDRERKAGCTLFEKGFFLTPSNRWARIFTLKNEGRSLFS